MSNTNPILRSCAIKACRRKEGGKENEERKERRKGRRKEAVRTSNELELKL